MYQIDLSPIRSPNKQTPFISFKILSPVLIENSVSQNGKINENMEKI